MIYSLKHDAESDAFVFASQRQGVSVFGNIAIADKCFITAIDKSVSVHITVFQVACLYVAESRNRKIGIVQVGLGHKTIAYQTEVLVDRMTFLFAICCLCGGFVHVPDFIAGV